MSKKTHFQLLHTVTFGLLLLSQVLLFACYSKQPSNKNIIAENIPKVDTIQLYPFDSSLYRYFPDTSLTIPIGQFRDYFFTKAIIFDSVLNKRDSMLNHNTYAAITNCTAWILYSDCTQYLKLKSSQSKQTNLALSFTGDYSPFSRLNSLEDYKKAFKSFPVSMQKNEIGQLALKRLEHFTFTKNIGKQFLFFKKEQFITVHDKTIKGDSVIKKQTPYYLVVFGASWCSPCIVEERMLKYWQPKIDSNLVTIIGVSVSDKPEKWKKYLEKEQFPWPVYLLPGDMNNKSIKELAFDGVPMNFLLDKNFTILAYNTDVRRLLEQIKELPVNNKVSFPSPSSVK